MTEPVPVESALFSINPVQLGDRSLLAGAEACPLADHTGPRPLTCTMMTSVTLPTQSHGPELWPHVLRDGGGLQSCLPPPLWAVLHQ